jgi:uncharacterized protein (TIGR01319 family)
MSGLRTGDQEWARSRPATGRARGVQPVEPSTTTMTSPYLLVDFGSTFTKVRAVDPGSGTLVGTAQHRTTVDSDLMAGFSAVLDELRRAGVAVSPDGAVLGCSSAGGGLRIAIIGLERDLTAEAAKQVALNSGGRVVSVSTRATGGALHPRPDPAAADLVLLVGGTDGGDEAFVTAAAHAVAETRLGCPVVFAGNAAALPSVGRVLDRAGLNWRSAPNVLPDVGRIEVDAVQAVVREAFIEHVIKGKRLSAQERFHDIVMMPTPDAVLAAVKLIARGTDAGELLAVDVGGATTDVYSSLSAVSTAASRAGSLVPAAPVARTVEADLGLRWSAPGLVVAARDIGLVARREAGRLAEAAQQRADDPGFLPRTVQESRDDRELARLAAVVAISRHAGRDRVVLTPAGAEFHRTGRDLRGVRTAVLTGGVFRAAPAAGLGDFLTDAFERFDRKRELVPGAVRIITDSDYVLAAAGLLSADWPELALRLVTTSYRGSLRRTDG